MLDRHFQTIKHIGNFLYDLVKFPYNFSFVTVDLVFHFCAITSINHLKECINVYYISSQELIKLSYQCLCC